MKIQKFEVSPFVLHDLWYKIKDLTNNKERDEFLSGLGLARIIKGKKYFLATYKPENLYRTNMKIVDEYKFFLAKIKYGF